ncbi:PICK1 protein, partial [Chaetops frenatus]|nr:PICK1 protein [Chaetops frenatus]
VFDNTPAALDGTVAAGDEITGVNGKSVKGKTKVEVAKMIQMVKGEVTIHYNKLQADPKQGKSLDIADKQLRRCVMHGWTRVPCFCGILCLLAACLNTELGAVHPVPGKPVKRAGELFMPMEVTLMLVCNSVLAFSVEEGKAPTAASEAFVKFSDAHRNIEKFGIHLLKTIKPMLTDLNTYLNKAIPDTRLTIKKYLDVKFEYLVSCL